jgi:hypothetical protein
MIYIRRFKELKKEKKIWLWEKEGGSGLGVDVIDLYKYILAPI